MEGIKYSIISINFRNFFYRKKKYFYLKREKKLFEKCLNLKNKNILFD